MNEQLNILPLESTEEKLKKTFKRNCDHCNKEYDASYKNSQYCSTYCRSSAHKKRKMTEPPSANTKPAEAKPVVKTTIPAPVFNGFDPHMQIVVDLLKNEIKRESTEKEEWKAECKKVQEAYSKLKDDTQAKEHAKALGDLEKAKPGFMDQVATFFGNLPAPILEQFSPAIGRLLNYALPTEGAAPGMAGVNGQLDEMQSQLLTWIASLPEPNQQSLFNIIGTMMQMDATKLSATQNQILNLLKNGSTLQGGTVDQSMYG